MTSDLSIFAARLRDFIAIVGEETSLPSDQAELLRKHYDAEFNGMALVLFALQFRYNPAYRKICDAQKIRPDTITHWTQIPAVPAAAFKELELTSLSSAERVAVFHSSGTTGQRPSRHFHSAESLAVYETSLWASFWKRMFSEDRLGIPLRGPDRLKAELQTELLLLAPPKAQAPHSSLVHMFEIIRRKLGAPDSAFLGSIAEDGTWMLDFDAILVALHNAAHDQRPLMLLGTAFSFVHLLDFLAERNLGFDLPPGSSLMETGGYKGRSRVVPKAELHSLLTRRLGIAPAQIVCEYGMSELSSQAYDGEVRSEKGEGRGDQRVFRLPPWARFQVVSPETGKEAQEGMVGLLRIFDLANVFSVMAIQTEDMAVRRGDGFELLGRDQLAEQRGCSLLSLDPQIVNHKS